MSIRRSPSRTALATIVAAVAVAGVLGLAAPAGASVAGNQVTAAQQDCVLSMAGEAYVRCSSPTLVRIYYHDGSSRDVCAGTTPVPVGPADRVRGMQVLGPWCG